MFYNYILKYEENNNINLTKAITHKTLDQEI